MQLESRFRFCSILAASALALSMCYAPPALARKSAAPYRGCTGCHGGQGAVDISLVPEGELVPGEPMSFTLVIREPNMRVAGFFATTEGIGEFGAGSGSQLSGSDVTHRGPMSASGGEASFSFSWTPPSEMGGGDIYVYALAGNDDNRSAGDEPAEARFSFAWGCEPVQLYFDFDQDGYGIETDTSVGCAVRAGWSLEFGDCAGGNSDIYPGAPEQCNEKDDNCNGEVDENTEPFPLYPDADGDGFGAPGSEPIMGCVIEAGWSPTADDCDDADNTAYPDAEEVCDGRDNDCDGRVDEGAKARCGVGWCERLAPSCYDDACYPGDPEEETCNGLDDDCDGEVDEGELCPAGQTCFELQCVASEDAAILAAMVEPEPPAMTDVTSSDVTSNGGGSSMPAVDGMSSLEPEGQASGETEPEPTANTSGQPTSGESTSPSGDTGKDTTSGSDDAQSSAEPGSAEQAGEPDSSSGAARKSGDAPQTDSEADGGCSLTPRPGRSPGSAYVFALGVLSLAAARRRSPRRA